jgi:hypothetical protein
MPTAVLMAWNKINMDYREDELKTQNMDDSR